MMSSSSDESGSEELVVGRRSEVVRRRSRRLKRLAEVYSDHYWALIEDLHSKHKQFYNNNINDNDNNNRCKTNGCKNKAMALTSFCLSHILSDPNQLLYKPCSYPIKSSSSGPIICMKPIVRSVVPSLCPQHLEKAEKSLRMALKKGGYYYPNNNNEAITASKIAKPKINVLVAEYIRQIQSKRRAAANICSSC